MARYVASIEFIDKGTKSPSGHLVPNLIIYMFEKYLLSSGLTGTQVKVLDYLLENGEKKANDLAKAISMPRGVAYKALDELAVIELIEKVEKPGTVSLFRAAHPRALEKLYDQKENRLREDKRIFEDMLPNLISSYNLSINRPGVKFYEGEEGFKKILFDTLNSKTEVLMIINREGMTGEEKFFTINNDYKKKRERAGVKKKILRTGTRPEQEQNTLHKILKNITI